MSDNEEKTSYYLRLVCMYIELSAETVLSVFKHHVPNNDLVAFLTTNGTVKKLEELKKKKILKKEEYDLVRNTLPDVNSFDISLLTTLIINLLPKERLPPPTDGWKHPPRNGDNSIASDLLRLRYIRNSIIGHRSKAQLEEWLFDEKWEETKAILLRLQRNIAPLHEARLQDRIQEYRNKKLDHSVERKCHQQSEEWYEEVSKIQNQVDDFLQKLEGFEVYFKNSSKYERYIVLLTEGGRIVLSSILTLKKHTDLQIILQEKEDVLRKEIKDHDQIKVLYPSESATTEQGLSASTWDVGLLATVILNALNDVDDDVREEVENIKHARENYTEIVLKAFDTDTYDHISSNLMTSLKILSKYLDTEQKAKFHQIIEMCKQQAEGNESLMTSFEETRSRGMKSIDDIYRETLQQTKELLKMMKRQNMDFSKERVLELKMITLGTKEEKTKLAEKILFDIWQVASGRSVPGGDFPTIEKEVYKILEEIKCITNITKIGVVQKCIILWIASISSSDILALIEYFESSSFHEKVVNIYREVGYYFDTVFGFRTSLTIESLYKINTYSQTSHQPEESAIRLQVSARSPAAIEKLLSLLKKENFSKSTATIANALSKHYDDRIELKLVADMKGLNGLFDEGETSSDSCSEDSDEILRMTSLEKEMENPDQEEKQSSSADGNEPNKNYDVATRSKLVKMDAHQTKEIQTYTVATKITKKITSDVGLVTKERTHTGDIAQSVRARTVARRRRKDCADAPGDLDETEYHKFSLIGIILDVSGSMVRGKNENVNMEERELVRLLLNVVVQFVKNSVSRYNRIFTVGCGASQGNGIFDIIGTFQRLDANLDHAADDTIESIFQILERKGASTTRNWANKSIVRQAVSEYEAKIILNNLKVDQTFADRFVRKHLPASCRDWGGFGFLFQKLLASLYSLFRQAAVRQVRDVVNQAMTDLNETVLMNLRDQSVYDVRDAASIITRNDQAGSNQNAQQFLHKLEPFIYGKNPLYSALREANDRFLKTVRTYPYHQRILFVMSDGYPEDEGNTDDIKSELKKGEVTVVTVYISRSSNLEPLRGYCVAGNYWDNGAKFLFDLCSTFPADLLARAMFMSNGWKFDITDDKAKLFFCTRHQEDLIRVSNLARNALCCRDSLVDLIPSVPVETYINQMSTPVISRAQIGEKSYANAFAIVLHLAKFRLLGRGDGYPDLKLLQDELNNSPGIEGEKSFNEFQIVCEKTRLHCRRVNSTGAMNAVAGERSVIAKFQLTNEEWEIFGRFYERNPTGILKKTDLDICERPPETRLFGHAVVLTSFNSECLLMMNSWGDIWADMGFFRVENAEVLGLEFIDVYMKDDDLSEAEKEIRPKHGSEVAEKRMKILTGFQTAKVTCPSCNVTSNVTAFRGTLSRFFCSKCNQQVSSNDADRTVLSLNMYLTLLSR